MKYIQLFFVFFACVFAGNRLPVTITPRDGAIIPVNTRPADSATINTTLIAACGDIRAILGPQGKNIAVCRHGDAIAVLYGSPTGDVNNPMAIKIAYSVNQGVTWTTFGPFTGNIRRMYGGVDGSPNFCTNSGELYFCYGKASIGYAPFPVEAIVEENVPSAPLPSAPIYVTWSDSLYIWQTGIAVAPDNPHLVIINGLSYLSQGNNQLYLWFSRDGYMWQGPFPLGVTINPAFGGNSGAKLRMGAGGYVAGIYNNSVGGITNDSWPHFIESLDTGRTCLNPVVLPVPHFDSAAGMFWWHEIEAEVVNNEPWLIANDIGGGGFWLYHGNGSPGNWTWDIWDLGVIGACSTWVGDTLFQLIPGQYGSLCHDPVSGMILATYKGLARIVQGGTNILCNGPAVCGVYTFDEGTTWHVARPMSTWNTMTYYDWNGTETAHRLPNVHDSVYAYTLWIHNTNFNLYFERGLVQPIVMNAVEENGSAFRSSFKVSPSISSGNFRIVFNIPRPGTADLALFEATGRRVADLFSGSITAGLHTVAANIRHLPPGTYFVRLQTDYGSAMGKVLLIH